MYKVRDKWNELHSERSQLLFQQSLNSSKITILSRQVHFKLFKVLKYNFFNFLILWMTLTGWIRWLRLLGPHKINCKSIWNRPVIWGSCDEILFRVYYTKQNIDNGLEFGLQWMCSSQWHFFQRRRAKIKVNVRNKRRELQWHDGAGESETGLRWAEVRWEVRQMRLSAGSDLGPHIRHCPTPKRLASLRSAARLCPARIRSHVLPPIA